MFDTREFGRYLSKLRKRADMTQIELADRLNLTRQAVSRYETGESFPDVSVLIIIAEVFGVSLDELIASGNPTKGESNILSAASEGRVAVVENIADIVGVAPFLKPSVLDKLAASLSPKGIDLSGIVDLAEFLNDESTAEMLKKVDAGTLDEELIRRLNPILDDDSKMNIFGMILDGELDWHMLRAIKPFARIVSPLVEAAVLEGILPWDALKIIRESD